MRFVFMWSLGANSTSLIADGGTGTFRTRVRIPYLDAVNCVTVAGVVGVGSGVEGAQSSEICVEHVLWSP